MPSKKQDEQQFRVAASKNDLEACKKLLQHHAVSIDASGADSGRTALHWAAEKEHVDMVRFLLDHNASITQDKQGFTAFDLTENPQISRLLMYHFRDYFEHHPPTNKHPLTMEQAIEYGFSFSPEMTQEITAAIQEKSLMKFHLMLKKNGLTVNSYFEGLPLMMHPHFILSQHEAQKDIALIDYCIDKKVNLNLKAHPMQRDAYQGTVLHAILANENLKNAMYILRSAKAAGLVIDSTLRDVEGKTIVLMGVLLRDTAFVSTCLRDFNSRAVHVVDKEGRSPLHYAYLFGDKAMVELLQAHGAALECRDKYGQSPLDMLKADASLIVSVFNKFHIDASTRMVSPGITLLEKIMMDRTNLYNEYRDRPDEQRLGTTP